MKLIYKAIMMILLLSIMFIGVGSRGGISREQNSVLDNNLDQDKKIMVSPNPDVYKDEESLREAGYETEAEIEELYGIMANNVIKKANADLIPDPGTSRKVLMIPVEFTDETFDVDKDKAHFEAMGDKLSDYYEQNSAYVDGISGITIDVTVSDVVTTSTTMATYGGDTSSPGSDDVEGPIYLLAKYAVHLLDLEGFDFGPYDTDNDGEIDHLIILHAGIGQEEDSSNSDAIWSHQWSIFGGYDVNGGATAREYLMVPETMTLGVLAHEFGHDIGLPDLYDTNGSTQGYSYGVGDWCLMGGSGSWNAKNGELDGESPSNISAWGGRLFLGWSDVTNIVASGPGTINNTSYPGDMYRIWAKGDENTDEYYLVELREIRNDQLFDEAIPGEGVLIWHVDEGKVDSTIDINSVNDDSSRLGVELEQADGLYEIKKRPIVVVTTVMCTMFLGR